MVIIMTQKPLKIIGSLTSPFVRSVRIACEELKLNYEMEVTTFFAKNTPEQESFIRNHNPLMRVPVLIDGNNTIIDSRIIINYLLKQYGNGNNFSSRPPLNIREENIITTTYGLIDSGVLRFILQNTQANINMSEGYAARSLERMYSALEWLNTQKEFSEVFGAAESLLICALDWIKKRDIANWSKYDNLVSLHEKFATRDSVIKTMIP